MFRKILQHKYLIKELSKREIANRYKGSFLGLLWALLTPFVMLLMFAFVFGEIFKAKWPSSQTENDMVAFSLNLFVGLSVFWFFSEIISKAPTLFSSVPNYVKKVIFPLWVLPLVSLANSLFHFMICMVILAVFLVLGGGSLSVSALSVPLVLAVTFPLLLGISLLLGSLGVYVKDIEAITGAMINMLIFLSPVFYPLSNVSADVQWVFHLNPLTFIIEQLRLVLLEGLWPDWIGLLYYGGFSASMFILGYWVFKSTKKGFADVL